jgi:hypothetical protein
MDLELTLDEAAIKASKPKDFQKRYRVGARALLRRFQMGEIGAQAIHGGLRDLLRNNILNAAGAAVGGAQELTPELRQAAEGLMREQEQAIAEASRTLEADPKTNFQQIKKQIEAHPDEWAQLWVESEGPSRRQRLSKLFNRVLEGINPAMRPAAPIPEKESQRAQRERQEEAARKVKRYKEEFDKRSEALARRVASGELTPGEFRANMLNEIRHMVTTSAAAGAGGFGNLQPDDIRRINDEVREQARYLDRWVAQLERQDVARRSEAQIIHRARMYGEVGGKLVHEMIDKAMHREWPELPFYPKDRTLCKVGCKCGWKWRVIDAQNGDADVKWQMQPAEHCLTCLARSAACNPLKIRQWQIVNMPANMNDLIAE